MGRNQSRILGLGRTKLNNSSDSSKTMANVSLLFKHSGYTQESPETIKDLRLNNIVDSISEKAPENLIEFIKKTLYKRPTNLEDIFYRQQILNEIEQKDILDIIENFCGYLHNTKELLKRAEKDTFEITKYAKVLQAVLSYISTIETTVKRLKKQNITSEGLRSFADVLDNYAKADIFLKLKEESQLIKRELQAVSVFISIKENKIYISKSKEESSLLEKLEDVLDFLKISKETELKLELQESPVLSHVEERILYYISKLYSDIFEHLKHFYLENKNFLNDQIERFYQELYFYLAFIEFTNQTKKDNLSFCIPEIKEQREAIFLKDGYDLALALQLQKEGKHIVTNDLFMDKNEQILLISGPNQGGKTTFARMFGQVFYLASLGLKVPSNQAKLFFFDHIYTHFEKEEKVQTQLGKLEDELIRAKNILENITDKSIVIFNEPFSATSLDDAYFLGEFVLKKLLEMKTAGVFVTFMHKLANIDKAIVSMTSSIDPENPTNRTFKITRKHTVGKTFAIFLAEKYCLTFDCLNSRLRK